MATLTLNINGEKKQVDVDPNTPLLWVLREDLDLVGTKYGCGMSQCGACTVHLNGAAVRSCVFPVSAVANQPITTIEGLSEDGTAYRNFLRVVAQRLSQELHSSVESGDRRP